MEKTYIHTQDHSQSSLSQFTHHLNTCNHSHCKFLISKIQSLYIHQLNKNNQQKKQNQFKIENIQSSSHFSSQLLLLKKQFANLQKNLLILETQNKTLLAQNITLKKNNLELLNKYDLQKQLSILNKTKANTCIQNSNHAVDLSVTFQTNKNQNRTHTKFNTQSQLGILNKQNHLQLNNEVQSCFQSQKIFEKYILTIKQKQTEILILKQFNKKSQSEVIQLNNQLRRLKGFLTQRQNIQNPRHKQIIKLQKLMEGF